MFITNIIKATSGGKTKRVTIIGVAIVTPTLLPIIPKNLQAPKAKAPSVPVAASPSPKPIPPAVGPPTNKPPKPSPTAIAGPALSLLFVHQTLNFEPILLTASPIAAPIAAVTMASGPPVSPVTAPIVAPSPAPVALPAA